MNAPTMLSPEALAGLTLKDRGIERFQITDRIRNRFNKYFMPEPNCGCWLWTGDIFESGYGQFSIQNDKSRVCLRAHRVSWRIYRGPIPSGLHVLHRCDTPSCVNPDHLFVGTHQDNMTDCLVKGRRPKVSGTLNPASKLSALAVDAIRGDNRPQRKIAAAYQISQAQVGRIKRRESWSHVD